VHPLQQLHRICLRHHLRLAFDAHSSGDIWNFIQTCPLRKSHKLAPKVVLKWSANAFAPKIAKIPLFPSPAAARRRMLP